jgi:hypothetical protein
MYIDLHIKRTRYSGMMLTKYEYFDPFSINNPIPNFMKICPVGAELFDADRQTDGRTDRHDEANTRFSKFCKEA